MQNTITDAKLKKYFEITEVALEKVRKKIIKTKFNKAKEILEMASNYINDAHYFENNKDFVNAFAALNYAHGWIDSGVRLGVFNVKDSKLFTIR